MSTVLLGALHGAFKHAARASQFELGNRRQNVFVLEMGLRRSLLSVVVLNLGVDASLGLIINPLTNEKLVLVVVEVGALAFTAIVDPVAFEMVTIAFGEHAVAVALRFVPLALIDVLVRVDHATLTLRHTIDPVAVVTITILVEEGASTVLLVLKPVAGVLSTQLLGLLVLHAPVGALAVALVERPHTFVLVASLVVLDAEAFFAIIAPVTNIL